MINNFNNNSQADNGGPSAYQRGIISFGNSGLNTQFVNGQNPNDNSIGNQQVLSISTQGLKQPSMDATTLLRQAQWEVSQANTVLSAALGTLDVAHAQYDGSPFALNRVRIAEGMVYDARVRLAYVQATERNVLGWIHAASGGHGPSVIYPPQSAYGSNVGPSYSGHSNSYNTTTIVNVHQEHNQGGGFDLLKWLKKFVAWITCGAMPGV
ncbi:hypothetical protein CALCODRAFT_488264 [Calocera cornea HHB12733]|uniref:Uncharacterized protein n=1 Tax=Calocera cornea HHB12733 TaxID=1353952 RepID=A0A165CM06_9BASI|nr:hypothetical protein CALCODRAFT_488264 [Calocera cornea HHB12733]